MPMTIACNKLWCFLQLHAFLRTHVHSKDSLYMSRKDNLCEQDRSRKYVDLLEQHQFQSEYWWLNPNMNGMTTASGNCSAKTIMLDHHTKPLLILPQFVKQFTT